MPPLPWSNGITECQVQTLKGILLDLQLTPFGPNMPSPCEILHNRMLQHPGKPSQPVDMESVRNYLLSHRQSQKMYFDGAHGTSLNEVQGMKYSSSHQSRMSTSLGPSSNKLPCPTATLWRPKANSTAEQGNKCDLSTSTFPVLHSPSHYPHSQNLP